MTIKIQRIVNVALIVLTWSTLPLMGVRNIKRFFPSTLVIVLFEGINGMIGKKRKWWFFYHKPDSHLFGEFPFYTGPFFVGSMWILKWTFGNFKRFVVFNMIANAFFAFPIAILARRMKYYTLNRINGLQFFFYYFYKAFILYWLQSLFEKNYTIKAKSNLLTKLFTK